MSVKLPAGSFTVVASVEITDADPNRTGFHYVHCELAADSFILRLPRTVVFPDNGGSDRFEVNLVNILTQEEPGVVRVTCEGENEPAWATDASLVVTQVGAIG